MRRKKRCGVIGDQQRPTPEQTWRNEKHEQAAQSEIPWKPWFGGWGGVQIYADWGLRLTEGEKLKWKGEKWR